MSACHYTFEFFTDSYIEALPILPFYLRVIKLRTTGVVIMMI
jgi:hypothetical protein